MANGIYAKTDQEFQSLLETMALKAPSMQAELGLSLQQVQEIQDASAEFAQAHYDAESALSAYRAAVQKKDTKREQATDLLARLIGTWKYNDAVSDASLAEVGVERNQKKRQIVPVHTPSLLQVRTDNTINTLTWSPNGNEYRTGYLIEYRYSENEGWMLLDVTTKKKYRHAGRTPGQRVFYRVSARRGNQSSTPTSPVGAYLGEATLARAA